MQTPWELIPKRLTTEEALNTKSLWSEIFYEDSKQFTDYYFAEKMPYNIGYGLEVDGKLAAMMFLTPYIGCLRVEDSAGELPLHYIVGVGTKREYRHRGYMDRLLRHALNELHDSGEPFAFLMPADPAIYTPYQFRYVYDRPTYTIQQKDNFPAQPMEWGEEEALADYAQTQLARRCQLYLKRDAAYYRRQKKESQAQNGDIYIWKENGEITGFYLYAREEDKEVIQEAAVSGSFAEKGVLEVSDVRKPIIMARITNVATMLSLMHLSPTADVDFITICLKIDDPLIAGNNGAYLWTVGKKESTIAMLEETDSAQVQTEIDALTEFLFGRKHCSECFQRIWTDDKNGCQDDGVVNDEMNCRNESVVDVYAKLLMIVPLSHLCLNEIV